METININQGDLFKLYGGGKLLQARENLTIIIEEGTFSYDGDPFFENLTLIIKYDLRPEVKTYYNKKYASQLEKYLIFFDATDEVNIIQITK